MDDGFAQGDHRRLEIPHPLVPRFHGFRVFGGATGRFEVGAPEANGGSPAEYSPGVQEYSSMNTYRGKDSAENTLYSSALCRKRKWHAICFSIDSTGPRDGNQQQKLRRRRKAMKTNLVRLAVLVVAAVMMAAPAFAGQTQAEREMSKGKEVGKVGSETRAPAPDPNDWEYRSAMETGNLPFNVGALSAGSAPAADVPKVDYGGVVYRIGIDTQ
jgi:hypothetical protein